MEEGISKVRIPQGQKTTSVKLCHQHAEGAQVDLWLLRFAGPGSRSRQIEPHRSSRSTTTPTPRPCPTRVWRATRTTTCPRATPATGVTRPTWVRTDSQKHTKSFGFAVFHSQCSACTVHTGSKRNPCCPPPAMLHRRHAASSTGCLHATDLANAPSECCHPKLCQPAGQTFTRKSHLLNLFVCLHFVCRVLGSL